MAGSARCRLQRCGATDSAPLHTCPHIKGAGLPSSASVPIEKHEDALGLSLPPAAVPFLDAWKRPEELVPGAPPPPLVLLRSAGGGGAAGGAPGSSGGAADAMVAPVVPTERRSGGCHSAASVRCAWRGGLPPVPMRALNPARPCPPSRIPAVSSAGKGLVATSGPVLPAREVEGRLFAGHESFEWLLAVISTVMGVEVRCPALPRQRKPCMLQHASTGRCL